MEDIYAFGSKVTWQESDIETGDAPDPEIVLENPDEKIESQDWENPTDTPAEVESSIDEETAALDKELADLEKLLSSEELNPENNSAVNIEVSDRLQDSIKTIQGLTKKINELELEKAERTKFWDNAWLSPELIILKANYEKAMKGDEAARSKIKELIAADLWFELADEKKVFLANSITSTPDVNIAEEKSWMAWFVLWA